MTDDLAAFTVTMCANCERPVTDWPRYARGSSTGWTHWGLWQGVRCPGRLVGAQPGRKIRAEEYLDWLDVQLAKPLVGWHPSSADLVARLEAEVERRGGGRGVRSALLDEALSQYLDREEREMTTYTTHIGTENAAWLAGSNSPLAGNAFSAEDNGDGTVTLDNGAYHLLRGLSENEDGCIERDEDGCRMWIEGESYEVTKASA